MSSLPFCVTSTVLLFFYQNFLFHTGWIFLTKGPEKGHEENPGWSLWSASSDRDPGQR